MNLKVLLVSGIIFLLGYYSVSSTVLNLQLQDTVMSMSANHESLLADHRKLTVDFESIRVDLEKSHSMYEILLENYSKTRIIYRSPASEEPIPIWGIEQPIDPNSQLSWNLLDAFINHIEIQASDTVQLVIVDLNNYVKLRLGQPYDAFYNRNGTQFERNEHVSQGCGIYVLVLLNHSDSIIRITPNVTATYSPTPFLTGSCSL